MGNNFAARLFSHAVRNACIPQRPTTSVAHQVTIAAERNLLSIPSSWCVNRPIRGHGQSAVYWVKSIDDISYAHFFFPKYKSCIPLKPFRRPTLQVLAFEFLSIPAPPLAAFDRQ